MTIEYTYPEPTPPKPIGAKIHGLRAYTVERDEWAHIGLRCGEEDVHPADVPEVCEAMMTLAGHEWPKPCGEDCGCEDLGEWMKTAQRWAAERIIARLRKAKYTGVDRIEYPDQPYTINQAIRIVREECGVAE